MWQRILRTCSANAANRTKLVLVVRADLRMSKGKTAAQCAHAAVLCSQRAQTLGGAHAKTLNSWLHEGQAKIVLRVEDYDELTALHAKVQAANIIAELVHDAGRTGRLAAGTATTLGIGPDDVKKIDELVSQLKLL